MKTVKTKYDKDIILLIDELCQRIISQESHSLQNMSLISGHAGIAISLYHAGIALQNKSYIKIAIRFLKKTLSNIPVLPNSSFGFGASGVLWVNQYLQNHGIDKLPNDVEEIDEYFLDRACNISDYDIFNGIIGYGLYFLIRHQVCDKKYAIKLLAKRLLDLSVVTDFGRTWIYIDPNTENKYHNMGLAHGIPSVLAFLSKIYPVIPSKQLKTAINETAQFICSFENSSDHINFFPLFIEFDFKKPNNLASRLAWCYGDVGVAYALLQAGISINEKRWIEKSYQIILKTTKRKLDTSGVKDVSICHGVAGLIHLYHKFYQYFDSPEILSAVEYWLEMLFVMKNKDENLKGFDFFDEGLVERFDILEGHAGVILALTTLISGNNDWDAMLLL